MIKRSVLTAIVVCAVVAAPRARAGAQAPTARLKDLAALQGISSAPLMGYGLVVGLNKTGDRRQTVFSTQSLANLLTRLGVAVDADAIKVENVAAVLVTADLPPYARSGARLDVTASSVGDARSLQGGTLLATPLKGPSGEIVALAQGPLSVGGFGGGSGGTTVAVNHLTVGRVPGGAIVQTAAPAPMPNGQDLTLALRDPDFVTASRIAKAINADLQSEVARVLDPGSVAVRISSDRRDSVPELMARMENLTVEVDTIARVVIAERTGTVVVGGSVRLGPAAVAHGNLSVRISTQYNVSQPNPMSPGAQTMVVPNQRVDVREGQSRLVTLPDGVTLDAVTSALNALGASPRDIIAIMQALKAAGALRAEIVVL